VLLKTCLCTTKSSSPAQKTFNDHTKSRRVRAGILRNVDGSAHVSLRLWQLLITIHLIFNMITRNVVRKSSFSFFN
jgi:hypothetical protein